MVELVQPVGLHDQSLISASFRIALLGKQALQLVLLVIVRSHRMMFGDSEPRLVDVGLVQLVVTPGKGRLELLVHLCVHLHSHLSQLSLDLKHVWQPKQARDGGGGRGGG
jgi:hypothetical protein